MEDLAQESSPLCGGANGVAENWTRERHDASLNPDGAAVNYHIQVHACACAQVRLHPLQQRVFRLCTKGLVSFSCAQPE